MTLPAGVETVTVSSGVPLALPDGTWQQGRLIFEAPALAVIGAQDVTLGGSVEVPLVNGAFSVRLVATDATGMNPTGWTYKVTAVLTNAPGWIQHISLPKAGPSVVLADVVVPNAVAGTYTVLADPSTLLAKASNLSDVASASAARTNLGLGTAATQAAGAFDAAGAASAAQTAAATDATTKANAAQSAATSAAASDATSKVATHAGAADPHGDRAAAATDATSKVTAHASATDPHGDRAYALAQLVPQAQVTIDTLFTADPFYIAHRGGGAAMPEHTIVAYDSAIAAGMKAIEVSCQVSADGVLFAMHDTTLDRVTNSTFTGTNATWTWAELQQKAKVVSSALLGPGWADQPIPTVREVLDRYLGKVVIFLEAKSSAAVVPLQTMLGTYAGANKSVVWKNYYTSNSFTWAHTNGYKTWAYMDTTTTSAQLDAVEAGVDYWGVPISSADAEFQMVLSRSTFKPVITWPVIRKAERDRVTAFSYNGHHVQGIMCSEPLYVQRTTPLRTSSAFARGVKAPGDLSASVEDQTFALKFDTVNSAARCPATSGNGELFGSLCPIVPGATGYKITFDCMFPVLPTGTLHAGMFFGQVSDNKHQFGVANTEACYRMLIRPVAGDVQLYTVAAAATSGVQITPTLTTAAMTAGTWMSFEIEVNSTQVILRRTDSTGWTGTFANTFIRGLNFGIQNGSLTDATTLPWYRNINVVAI